MKQMLRDNLEKISDKKGQRVLVTFHKVGDRIESRDELVESTFNKEEANVSEVSADKEPNETGKAEPLFIDAGRGAGNEGGFRRRRWRNFSKQIDCSTSCGNRHQGGNQKFSHGACPVLEYVVR